MATETSKLTAGERRDLTRIVKGRFQVLRHQARVEAKRVVEAERRRIHNDRAKEIQRFATKIEGLNKQQKSLGERADALRDEILGAGFTFTEKDSDKRLFDANGIGVKTRFDQSGSMRYWDDNAIKDQLLAEISRQEQVALETLIIGDLGSDAAREFVQALPTIEQLAAGPGTLVAIGA